MDFNKLSLIILLYLFLYGIIKLRLIVDMKYFLDVINGYFIGYINVFLVDFKVEIFGGNFCIVSFLRYIIINGLIFEDFDIGWGNLFGIEFFWLCWWENESFFENIEDFFYVRFKEVF